MCPLLDGRRNTHLAAGGGLLGVLGTIPTVAQDALEPSAAALPGRDVLLDLAVNLGIGGLALGFAILHALIFCFYPREKGNLYFSVFALALASNGGLDSMARYGSFGPRAVLALKAANAVAVGLLFVFLVLFLASVVSPRTPRWIRTFAALASVVVVTVAIPSLNPLVGPLYVAFMAWSAFLAVWLPVRALWLGIDGAWALGLSSVGWILFFTSEGLKQMLHLSVGQQAVGFGSGALLIQLGFSIYLARRIARGSQELEELNSHLERRVDERTAELVRSEERERRANQAKSEFLANMSHEIRTPMNAVIGLSELLATSEPEPKNRRLAETIRSSASSLLAILDDVLDFSKIEAGEIELERTAFEVEACVTDAVGLFTTRASEKGLELREDFQGDLPRLLGDPTRLRQVVVNLVGNAVKFTEKGTVGVTVASRGVDSPDGGEEPREVYFTVRDTGIGIPEDRLGALFQPFTQVDTSVARHFGGTGLGLAISKRLVEAMGGRIWAESEPGIGSVFHFTISAAAAPAVDEALPPEGAPPDKPSAEVPAESVPFRVLLAEDNEVNQIVTCLMLKRLGWRADVVADGREAVEAFEASALGPAPYDVILMDVRMPDVDGIEASRRIQRSSPASSRPYIVALTASALVEDRERCSAAGMSDFVSKPVTIEALAAALEKAKAAIRSRRTPDEPGAQKETCSTSVERSSCSIRTR